MARPTRNNAEYFTHPANFRNDRRVKAVRARFGLAGYALLLMLMEVLTDADFTQLSTDDLEMELLAGDFGVSVTEIDSLLQLCEKIGLLSRNGDGNLICEDLNINLRQVFDKRSRSREAEEARKKTVSVIETPVSVAEIPQSKVKKSKEKDTDVSTAKVPVRTNVKLTEGERESLIERHGLAFVEQCFDKLSAQKLSTGKEYKSDYGAINSWVIDAVNERNQKLGGRSPTTPLPTGNISTKLKPFDELT